MAPSRTRNADSDGPSTADASANEDVEMQDQNGKVNGFNKFTVRAPCIFTAAAKALANDLWGCGEKHYAPFC
jgi:hypothetical protein